MMEYIPFAIINAGAFTPDNDIILVCIVEGRGRWRAWGGMWFEQHRSIRSGETRESRCQIQFGRLVLGMKPVLSFELIHEGVIDTSRCQVQFGRLVLGTKPVLSFALIREGVIDTSRGFNSAKIATVLLAADVDYTDGMAEA